MSLLGLSRSEAIRIITSLYRCQNCGRTWREWYAVSTRELHESMCRHEDALSHSVHYIGERAVA